MYNVQVFHCFSKAWISVLVIKPWEAIKFHVSMYISMLDMVLSHYEYILGPPSFIFNFGKIKFSHKIKPFFNGLNGKFQIVIKVWSEVWFWRGDARFHTQSIPLTPKPTFHMLRATKCHKNAKEQQNGTK